MSQEKNPPVKAGSAFDFLASADTRKIVKMRGIYVRGFVEPWNIVDKQTGEEQSGTYGCIQILQPAANDTARLALNNIKVTEESYGLIDLLNKQYELKPIALDCEIQEGYGNQKGKTVLLPDQSALKAS